MNYQWKSEEGKTKGYTVAELLVVLFIMMIVITAVYLLFFTSQRTYTAQDQLVEAQQNARQAIELMTQELRLASYDPNVNRPAGARIIAATPTTLQFSADLNGDGTLMGAETVTYAWVAPANLTRDDGEGPQLIAENIVPNADGTPLFTYFLLGDGTYNGIGSGTDDNGNGQTDELGELLMTTDMAADARLAAWSAAPTNQLLRNAIRIVRISITARTSRVDPGLQAPRQSRLSADVALRNNIFIR